MMSSGSVSMSSAAITPLIASRTPRRPSLGPYWSACAVGTEPIRRMNSAGSKVEVSGSPPASEITSGRSVTAIRSRIAEERITCVRLANRPA